MKLVWLCFVGLLLILVDLGQPIHVSISGMDDDTALTPNTVSGENPSHSIYEFECPVCLETICGNEGNQETDGVHPCPQCHRQFCPTCVASHTKTKLDEGLTVACPMCNFEWQAAPVTPALGEATGTIGVLHRNRAPLAVAAFEGDLAAVHRELEGGADVNVRDFLGRTPLDLAVRNGHVEIVRLLLLREGIVVDSRDNREGTPLMQAAIHEDTEMLQLLLESGADIDAEDDVGWNALFSAISWNQVDAVHLLISRHADLCHRTAIGQTPLSMAALSGHVRIVVILGAAHARCSIV